MTNYREYFSFEPAQEFKDLSGTDPKRVTLDEASQKAIERAIDEIAKTPEGKKLIEEAAQKGPDGKINIMQNPGGISISVSPNDIFLGSKDSTAEYISPQTGEATPISIQQILYHELYHIAHHDKMSAGNETEAVTETNKFMQKYYGESPRDPDTTIPPNLTGSPEWDYNNNFKPGSLGVYHSKESMRQDLLGVDDTKVAEMSPEIQSLHTLRNYPDHFNAQYEELKQTGSLETAQFDMDTLHEQSMAANVMEPAEVKAATNKAGYTANISSPPILAA